MSALSLLLAILVGGIFLSARQSRNGRTRPPSDGMALYRLRVKLRRLFRRPDQYDRYPRNAECVIFTPGATVASLAAELESVAGALLDVERIDRGSSQPADLLIWYIPANADDLRGFNHGK